jgi:hypothetical protein
MKRGRCPFLVYQKLTNRLSDVRQVTLRTLGTLPAALPRSMSDCPCSRRGGVKSSML